MPDQRNPLVKQKSTNNPYRIGASLILRRTLWDLNPISWKSRNKLKRLYNSKMEQKAVIVCNGPSLNEMNMDSLHDVYTFGLNKINLLFEHTSFRPSSIVSVNQHVLEQNRDFFNNTDIQLFLAYQSSRYIKKRNNITFIHTNVHRYFAKDVSVSLYEGATVTFVAMQIAFHMGFTKVALIGCDHNFHDKGYESQLVKSEGIDLNHFNPDYFAKGMKWQLPDLFESEVSYMMAKKMFEAYSRKILNCTIGGNLDIYDRMSLKDFLSE